MEASVSTGHAPFDLRLGPPLRLASDARLVALLRGGRAAAFETLYERHHRALLSYCRHVLGSREDAEDAVQQTFASAYRALVADEREIELRPWLFAIARNACLSALRKRRPQAELDGNEAAAHGLSAEVEQREELRNLLRDLQQLPEQQRSALLLAELGGLSHAQIASVIDCKPEQVKAFVFQARSTLIAEREARSKDCGWVRQQLAAPRNGPLRSPLRRHLRHCPGCSEFREQLREQRRMLAVLLPVVPSLLLKQATLKAALGPAYATGGAGGVTAAGLAGLKAASAAKAISLKALLALALAGAAAGTGTLVVATETGHSQRHRAVGANNHGRAPHSGAGVRTKLHSSAPVPVGAGALPGTHRGAPATLPPAHGQTIVVGVPTSQALEHRAPTAQGRRGAKAAPGARSHAKRSHRHAARHAPARPRHSAHVRPLPLPVLTGGSRGASTGATAPSTQPSGYGRLRAAG